MEGLRGSSVRCHLISESFRESFSSVDWRAVTEMRIILPQLHRRVDPNLISMMASASVPDLVAALKEPR